MLTRRAKVPACPHCAPEARYPYIQATFLACVRKYTHFGIDVAENDLKPLRWVGASKKDLLRFPHEVQHVFGYALYLAQKGDKHRSAKPLAGFGGAGVLEVVEDYDGDAYRAVYTVRFAGAVYVLHSFQKKSRRGIATPAHEMELIRARLKQAEQLHARKTEGNDERR